MNQNARAIAVLDRLRTTIGLSEDGRDALIQLANPFTDFESRRVGYFDANQAASVVQCIKKSTVISAPGTANWNCNIATLPILGHFTAGNYVHGHVAGSGFLASTFGASSTSSVGPVNIIKGEGIAPLNLCTTASAIDGKSLSCGSALSVDTSPFLDGNSRLIGMGFEVHNTTAEVYRQGAVAVYHMPQNSMLDRNSRVALSNDGAPLTPTLTRLGSTHANQTYSDIPGTLADALLLSGTRQWEAADGCMCIPTLVSNDIPTVRRESIKTVIVDRSQKLALALASGTGAVVSPACFEADPIIGQLPTPVVGVSLMNIVRSANKYTNFNTSGAFFSGLSPQTTLVVNVIYYIERFPAPFETDLIVLAQPGPACDPIAAELYSILMREMPPGVKVGDNADGDWFYSLVSGASKFLGPSLAAAGPLGIAGNVLANGAGAWADKKLKEGKKAQPKAIVAKPKKAPINQGATWDTRKRTKQTPAQKKTIDKNWSSKSGMAK